MKHLLLIPLISLLITSNILSQRKPVNNNNVSIYFPEAGNWQHQPAASAFDVNKLTEAIQFAKDHETKQPRNMELSQAMTFGKEPFGEGIGPFADRGDPTGVIVHHGYIVAEWGEPSRVDMTHSVTKSFLSTVVGLAVERGLIKSVNDTVAKYVPPIEVYDPLHINRSTEEIGQQQLLTPFASPHNRTLTWDVMLRQTSDWEGTLWGKPEWADRPDANANTWLTRKRNVPGAVYEYNDVRVNALALAATNVWRKPLPQVLKENIMDAIGASNTWRWTGYRNSWIVLDGQPVQSVSGGGHWGGGMFINAYDMARFGLLTLHKGNWNGKQLISQQWIQQSLTPTAAQPTYGYMNFFLNTDRKYMPSAPVSAFVHVGNGTNIIYVDAEHDLVMVVRWIENNAVDGMIKKVLDALK
jgi:CubicO group peptidase (beta-lactamase class C family)